MTLWTARPNTTNELFRPPTGAVTDMFVRAGDRKGERGRSGGGGGGRQTLRPRQTDEGMEKERERGKESERLNGRHEDHGSPH